MKNINIKFHKNVILSVFAVLFSYCSKPAPGLDAAPPVDVNPDEDPFEGLEVTIVEAKGENAPGADPQESSDQLTDKISISSESGKVKTKAASNHDPLIAIMKSENDGGGGAEKEAKIELTFKAKTTRSDKSGLKLSCKDLMTDSSIEEIKYSTDGGTNWDDLDTTPVAIDDDTDIKVRITTKDELDDQTEETITLFVEDTKSNPKDKCKIEIPIKVKDEDAGLRISQTLFSSVDGDGADIDASAVQPKIIKEFANKPKNVLQDAPSKLNMKFSNNTAKAFFVFKLHSKKKNPKLTLMVTEKIDGINTVGLKTKTKYASITQVKRNIYKPDKNGVIYTIGLTSTKTASDGNLIMEIEDTSDSDETDKLTLEIPIKVEQV